MLRGFKNFLMQGDLIVIAVGLVVALAFSTLIKAFTDSIITPLINAIAGGGSAGKGIGWTLNGQRVRVRVRNGKVFVGGARVTTPDVAASNGVIHVINKVLIPR